MWSIWIFMWNKDFNFFLIVIDRIKSTQGQLKDQMWLLNAQVCFNISSAVVYQKLFSSNPQTG